MTVDDFVMNKILDQIKEIIGVRKFDGTKILINNDNKLSDVAKILINKDDKLWDDITLKRVAILMQCVIKDRNKFYPQLNLDHALYDE